MKCLLYMCDILHLPSIISTRYYDEFKCLHLAQYVFCNVIKLNTAMYKFPSRHAHFVPYATHMHVLV